MDIMVYTNEYLSEIKLIVDQIDPDVIERMVT
jgi:hypothetical protein